MVILVLLFATGPAVMTGIFKYFISGWVSQSLPDQSDSYYTTSFLVLIGLTIVAFFIQTISILFMAIYISQ